MTTEVRVLPIRHHGPISARRVATALADWRPDHVLIEGPPEANACLAEALHVTPPVALLLHDPGRQQPSRAIPLADCSPEWQALLWALRNAVPVRFIDLPNGVSAEGAELPPDEPQAAYLPSADGTRWRDGLEWWDDTQEEWPADAAANAAILEMMTLLRAAAGVERSGSLREAAMRHEVRSAVANGATRAAVVCGAWHGPALAAWNEIDAAADAPRFPIRFSPGGCWPFGRFARRDCWPRFVTWSRKPCSRSGRGGRPP